MSTLSDRKRIEQHALHKNEESENSALPENSETIDKTNKEPSISPITADDDHSTTILMADAPKDVIFFTNELDDTGLSTHKSPDSLDTFIQYDERTDYEKNNYQFNAKTFIAYLLEINNSHNTDDNHLPQPLNNIQASDNCKQDTPIPATPKDIEKSDIPHIEVKVDDNPPHEVLKDANAPYPDNVCDTVTPVQCAGEENPSTVQDIAPPPESIPIANSTIDDGDISLQDSESVITMTFDASNQNNILPTDNNTIDELKAHPFIDVEIKLYKNGHPIDNAVFSGQANRIEDSTNAYQISAPSLFEYLENLQKNGVDGKDAGYSLQYCFHHTAHDENFTYPHHRVSDVHIDTDINPLISIEKWYTIRSNDLLFACTFSDCNAIREIQVSDQQKSVSITKGDDNTWPLLSPITIDKKGHFSLKADTSFGLEKGKDYILTVTVTDMAKNISSQEFKVHVQDVEQPLSHDLDDCYLHALESENKLGPVLQWTNNQNDIMPVDHHLIYGFKANPFIYVTMVLYNNGALVETPPYIGEATLISDKTSEYQIEASSLFDYLKNITTQTEKDSPDSIKYFLNNGINDKIA